MITKTRKVKIGDVFLWNEKWIVIEPYKVKHHWVAKKLNGEETRISGGTIELRNE